MKQYKQPYRLLVACVVIGFCVCSCTSFKPEVMKEIITADIEQRHDSVTNSDGVAGYVERQINIIPPNEPIYVAYYDTSGALTIENGIYDIGGTSDTAVSLVRPDTVYPRTLTVALRNVGGVYRTVDFPQARTPDPIATVGLIILVVGIVGTIVLIGLSGSSNSMPGIPWDFAP